MRASSIGIASALLLTACAAGCDYRPYAAEERLAKALSLRQLVANAHGDAEMTLWRTSKVGGYGESLYQ